MKSFIIALCLIVSTPLMAFDYECECLDTIRAFRMLAGQKLELAQQDYPLHYKMNYWQGYTDALDHLIFHLTESDSDECSAY